MQSCLGVMIPFRQFCKHVLWMNEKEREEKEKHTHATITRDDSASIKIINDPSISLARQLQ